MVTATLTFSGARAHNQRTSEYLLGMPLVGDFLEEGLSMLGYSCAEFERGTRCPRIITTR